MFEAEVGEDEESYIRQWVKMKSWETSEPSIIHHTHNCERFKAYLIENKWGTGHSPETGLLL